MPFYQTDGKNVKSLTLNDVFGAGVDLTQDMQPRAAYAAVPFVRRAVRLRANAVAGVPVTLQKGEKDMSSSPAFASLMAALPSLIWKTEFALCLSLYGAYWRRTANTYGTNPTPEWLLPNACWPYITADQGFAYVRYIRPIGVPGAGTVEMLRPDQIVSFWLPSLDRANWPGPPPGETAMSASNALASKDTFVANYFKSGALKGILLQVPSGTARDERERLKSWWGSVVSGVRNAWKANVISADVKPIVVGDGLGDIGREGAELVNQYRQDIAAAFEVPESMLLSNAANYATAREERIGFYEETVFPALQFTLDCINMQWLTDQYGVELVAHPEQTEPRQDAQVQQAAAITELVGQPVLTVNEGRAWLGMEPTQEEATPDESADYQQMDAEAAADDTAEQDAEKITDAERVTEKDAERQKDAERTPPPSKTLRLSSGHYATYPGSATRALERAAVWGAHAAQRRSIQARHGDEIRQAKQRHIAERRSAPDAKTRLRLVRQHQGEIVTLHQRHAAERGMLRSLHGAERARVRDRHAAMRLSEEVMA